MKTFWQNGVCSAIVFALLLSGPGCAPHAESSSAKANWLESFGVDLSHLPNDVIQGYRDTAGKGDNMAALLLAGGVSIALRKSGADDQMARDLDLRIFNHWTEKPLDYIGSPAIHFGATSLWYALSTENGDYFNQRRAWTMLTALSVTGLTTAGLKAIVNDDTPNGKRWAWPSGHTSSSFTVASVLDEFYGPRVGIPAYAAASVVAIRMMDTGDHWGSDVVFGAVLGWVVGHSVAGKHMELELAGFDVVPYTASYRGGSIVGVNLMRRF